MADLRVVAIIQARLDSSRFPRKSLANMSGIPLVAHVVNRVKQVPDIDAVVAAIPFSDDLILADLFRKSKVDQVIYGSEKNVLFRFWYAAMLTKADIVMRVTGDCPLFSSTAAEEVLKRYKSDKHSRQYWSNDTTCSGWPDGTDVEVFSFDILQKSHLSKDKTKSDCEHVTTWMRRKLCSSVGLCEREKDDLSELKLSIDTPDDLVRVQQFYDDGLYPEEWNLS